MKTTLLLAVAVAGIFTLTASANAAEPAMSPKGKALADSLRTVPGKTVGTVNRLPMTGSPRAIAQSESLRRVSGTTSSSAPVGYEAITGGVAASPKYRQHLNERGAHVTIAPLK